MTLRADPDPVREITKDIALELREAVNEAVSMVAAAYDMKGTVNGVRFLKSSIALDVELAVKNAAGEAMTRERSDWIVFAPRHGFDKDDIGKVFLDERGNSEYQIVGWRRGAKRYKVVTKVLDTGTLTLFTPSHAKQLLAATRSKWSK